MSRVRPLSREGMTDAQRRVADTIASGPRGAVIGPFEPLLHSPELADRVQQLGAYLRFEGALPRHLSELAILVTARHWSAQFEWWAHARLAREAGLVEPIIEAIRERRRPPEMQDEEEAVYDFATEVYRHHRVSDATYARIVDRFGEAGAAELAGLLGYYALISITLNVFEVPVPSGETAPL